ncbi:MAG: hydantoinase B/oxoprolinase family protein [Deltaproteobacteria bacterium]|nr:hydantoinase B/oxoprolinase family protein [Deltaproteobacteria bacterium]
MAKYRADKVTMQVIRYALEAVADDMGYALQRMGRSTIVKEIMDFNCAVLGPEGHILSQAHLCPLMMFSLPRTCFNMVKHYDKGSWKEGDVVITNDPYLGGQHLPDVQFFSPIIYDKTLVGFAANICHQLDMGGSVPGGVAGGLTEIYQEGLRIPFVKLYREGEENEEIFSLIGNNIRIPEKTLADFRAQAATTLGGVSRVKELISKYGLGVFRECINMLMDYSENRIRRFIKDLPNGTYKGEDWIDDDGYIDEPVKLQVNIKIRDDTMRVDFRGSSPQTKGNINCPLSCSEGGIFYTVVGMVDPYMPINSGCFRPVEVRFDEGLITSPLPPAAVTARSQTMTKIVEAMLKAMAPIIPDRVVAGSHGQACTCSFTGTHPETDKRFTYVEIQGGGCGARPDKDGADGQDLHLGRFMNTPVEAAELEYPVMIERYEFIPDSGGAGKWRGGLSLRRDIRFHADVTFARYSDRRKFAPQGLFGGMEGSRADMVLNPGSEGEQVVKSKGVGEIKAGDLLSICLPGSGGYGLPWERDPERVQWDVINGKVNLQSAREHYSVSLNSDLSINEKETEALRAERGKGNKGSLNR